MSLDGKGDGPGVSTQAHTPEEGYLCVVTRHTHCLQTPNYKNTKIKDIKTQNSQTLHLRKFMAYSKLQMSCSTEAQHALPIARRSQR